VKGDSRLVINQAKGKCHVKAPHLKPLHDEAMKLASRFKKIAFEWVPREENTRADALGRAVLSKAP
jgi:ribonuclease HI